ncbi:hypothetical protein MAR_000160 [Mya arenaria]|uniref:Uncharacterized protein n=1 Tax=Mya arenaria TaxID=6604 RepID=A0ABY7F7Z5_MYAAR|nr:hypothetical protein MAR_000160 [Mya arenaria]
MEHSENYRECEASVADDHSLLQERSCNTLVHGQRIVTGEGRSAKQHDPGLQQFLDQLANLRVDSHTTSHPLMYSRKSSPA